MYTFIRRHPRLIAAAVLGPLVVVNALVRDAPNDLRGPADPVAVHQWLEGQIQDAGIPGAAIVIVKDGKIVDEQGFGTADATGRPVTATTPFMIGSLSKSITALAVMQLVDAGRIDLDTPVRQYLPEFSVADPASDRITVRELLDHTSGLPTAAGTAPLSQPVTTLDARVRDLAGVRLVSEPGTGYTYSNANFLVLGRLIEAVSGRSYDDYVASHVFSPLDMAHAATDRATATANGLTMAHRIWFGLTDARTPIDRPDLVPAGFISASADDLGHFLIAQLDEGRYDGRAVVSPGAIQAMQTGTVPTGIGDERSGMGWVSTTLDGEPIVAHEGSTTDMAAIQVLVPGRHLGVAVLFNAQSTIYELLHKSSLIGYGAASLLMGREPAGTIQALYPVLDLLFVGLFVWLVGGLVRLVRRPAGPAIVWGARSARDRVRFVASRVFRVYLDVFVPFALLVKVPDLLGAPWTVLVRVDLGLILFGVLVVRLLDGGIRVARVVKGRRGMRAAVAPSGALPSAVDR